MRTNQTVKTEINGTLKKKKQNLLHTMFAVLMLSTVSLMGMSFTTEDTTRAGDSIVKTALSKAVTDNGLLVNITPSTNLSIRKADMVMDANFRMNEALNLKMAVVFSKKIAGEANEADDKMSDKMNLDVMVPAFNSNIATDVETADANMDKLMNNEVETILKVKAFRTKLGVQINEADEAMDVIVNVIGTSNVKPNIAELADRLMDDMIFNIKNVNPKSAIDADNKMDKLINNL